MSIHGTITKDNHAALWHGRFKEGPDAAAVEFETSINDDMRMAMADIDGSIAHAKMLAKQKLITKAEEKQKEEAALNALVEQLLREKQAQSKVAEQPAKAAEQKVEAPASKNPIKKILK